MPQCEDDIIEVPYQQLSQEALTGVIEEYITREGTDYGDYEYSLEEKKSHIYKELKRGKIKIYFDIKTNSCQLVTY